MKLKIWIGVMVGLVLALIGAVWLMQPDPPPPGKGSGELMNAIVYYEYGSPDVLRLEQVEKMLPNENQVLVKVRAASANPLDWHYMRGTPYMMRIMGAGLRKPIDTNVGVDVAGEVVAVGANVTQFKPGDAVFGIGNGSFAEYVRASQKRIVLKPDTLSYEDAASIPVAAITALQALRDKGRLQSGQKVLINGASGGVGTFSVQIAKALGADVTGVCSTRNIELVRSLGADRTIDYTKQDFSQSGEQYDLILDNVGNRTLGDFRRVLKPQGIYVLVGGGASDANKLLGSFARVIKTSLVGPFTDQTLGMMIADVNQSDLNLIKEWIAANKVRPVIDRTYPLTDAPAAIRYLEEGHARGKVVVTVAKDH